MQCELCGRQALLFRATVEGTELSVCAACGKHGKMLRQFRPQHSRPARKPISVEKEAEQESVVPDYAQRIRTAREKKGMTQKDFANLVGVKESILHKLENKGLEPPLDLARKLERALHIQLVSKETVSRAGTEKKRTHDDVLTIGDIIKL